MGGTLRDDKFIKGEGKRTLFKSRAVDGKRFLESNASSTLGTLT